MRQRKPPRKLRRKIRHKLKLKSLRSRRRRLRWAAGKASGGMIESKRDQLWSAPGARAVRSKLRLEPTDRG
ncbi:hypothetical protein DYGSA30_36400 [Dyella sp. GSA-30]|nr:hypothetical protein DYGSA30_36400 [Dyella sp. GSA-30]